MGKAGWLGVAAPLIIALACHRQEPPAPSGAASPTTSAPTNAAPTTSTVALATGAPATSASAAPAAPTLSFAPIYLRIEPEQIVLLQPIRFEIGKWTRHVDAYPILEELAKVLAERSDIERLEIQSHGEEEPDRAVSVTKRRGEAVLAFLVKQGITKGRLTAANYGASKPLVPTSDPDAARKNRRIELHIRPRP